MTEPIQCVQSAGSNRRLPLRHRFFLPAVLLSVLALVGVGCDSHTCQNACAQYYGTGDGQCGRNSVLTDGTTSTKALSDCTKECRDAIYTTTASTAGSTDAGGYSRLENEQDAVDFIDCIVDKDFSPEVLNTTCEDLFFDCPWIQW